MGQLAGMFVLTCNAFSENAVILHDGEGGAIVCDPGMSTAAEWAQFENALAERNWTPRAVLLTHAHLDHVLGCAGMVERYGLHPRLLAEDGPTYAMAPQAAQLYGVPMDALPDVDPTPLEDGETLVLGSLELEVRHAPGHAPGHVVFTDLPGGDAATLARSIENVLFCLPGNYTVWPGHGPETTIAEEKASNPFVNAAGTGMMQR